MESRGNTNYPSGGVDYFASTMHWGPDFFTNQFTKTTQSKQCPSGNFNDDFHTFGLYWDSKQIYTYLDTDANKVLHVDHST